MRETNQNNASEFRAGRALAKGVLISGSTNVVLRGLEALSAILLLAWLSVYEYGIYQLSLSLFELFAGFLLAGLSSTILADVSRNQESEESKRLFSSYIYLQILIGVVLWATFFFGSFLFSYWVEGSTHLVRLASFFFLAAPFESGLKLAFQTWLKFAEFSLYKISFIIFRIALIASVFYWGDLEAGTALMSLLAASLLSFAVFFFASGMPRLLVFPDVKKDYEALKTLILAHGKWGIYNDFIGNIGSSVRPFVIRVFLGAEAVAIFMMAHNLAGYLSSVFPIRDVLSPVLPRKYSDPRALLATFDLAVKYSTIAFIIIAIGGAVGVPILIEFLFPKYEPALPLLYLYLVAMPLLGFRLTATPLFNSIREQKYLFRITVLRLLGTTFLSLLLTWAWGLPGAALEASLGVALLTTGAYLHGIKKLFPNWKFPWGILIRFNQSERKILKDIVARIRVGGSGSSTS